MNNPVHTVLGCNSRPRLHDSGTGACASKFEDCILQGVHTCSEGLVSLGMIRKVPVYKRELLSMSLFDLSYHSELRKMYAREQKIS